MNIEAMQQGRKKKKMLNDLDEWLISRVAVLNAEFIRDITMKSKGKLFDIVEFPRANEWAKWKGKSNLPPFIQDMDINKKYYMISDLMANELPLCILSGWIHPFTLDDAERWISETTRILLYLNGDELYDYIKSNRIIRYMPSKYFLHFSGGGSGDIEREYTIKTKALRDEYSLKMSQLLTKFQAPLNK